MINVLHIVNWYPTENEPNKALWIKRHIETLEGFSKNYVAHIEVLEGKRYNIHNSKDSKFKYSLILTVPIKRFFVIEILNLFLLLYVIVWKFRSTKIDVLNFHIAYPQLVYFHWFKRFLQKRRVVVTEHWSAYHYSFNITKPEKLTRIKNIFKNDLHWITVSQALKNDLKLFSENTNLKVFVVPNVVDTSLFKLTTEENATRAFIPTFFMVGNWKWPKLPILLLQAFKIALNKGMIGVLRIGGYGQEWATIEKYILDNDLNKYISLLGPLHPLEIVREMQMADAYVHCSEYETFSVVCAEALCCGTPVIASKVGAIPEFVDCDSGVLIDNDLDQWVKAFLAFSRSDFNSVEISLKASAKFSSKAVGIKYSNVLFNVKK
jgi:L-malate glycosyltransferase